MSDVPDDFVRPPLWFFEGDNRRVAVDALKDYAANYTGAWFDRLADREHPNQITARDLLAVTTLGVTIPANKSIWILNDGAQQITELLSGIPPKLNIWDPSADLTAAGSASKLWYLLRDHKSSTPHEGGGLGTTKLSKILAAKRPNLVPIEDGLLCKALFDGKEPNDYWDPWVKLHRSPDGEQLRRQALDVRNEAGVLPDVSVLRIIDIVIWHWSEQHYGEIEDDLDTDD